MKVILLLLFIQIFAYRLAFAAEDEMAITLSGPTLADIQQAKRDDCKELLPKLESDYANFDQRFQENASRQRSLNEAYMQSFNQMTSTLFKVTDETEEEASMMKETKLMLRESISQYNAEKTVEKAKPMQENYASLAEKIYAAAVLAQKKIDRVKEAYATVEKTRSDYENSRSEVEALEHEKLNLESQVASMRIRCQTKL